MSQDDGTSMPQEDRPSFRQDVAFYPYQRPRDPPMFDGELNKDSQKWLRDFERVAVYNRWDDSLRLANVYFFLSGTARLWLENHEEGIISWDNFKESFTQVFGYSHGSRQAEEKLKTRAQKSGELTESYIQDVLFLCHKVNADMNEEEIVGHLMKGVAEELYQALLVKDPQTPDEFVNFCRKIESKKQNRIGRKRYERLPNVTSLNTNNSSDLSLLIREIVQEEIKKVLNVHHEQEQIYDNADFIQDSVLEEVHKVLTPITRPSSVRVTRPRVWRNRQRQQNAAEPSQPRRTDEWRTYDNRPICYHCGRPGHVIRFCRERRQAFENARLRRQNQNNSQHSRFELRNEDFPTLEESTEQRYRRSPSPYPRRGRSPVRRRQSPSPLRGSSRSPFRDEEN
jgi:hypothetical protein